MYLFACFNGLNSFQNHSRSKECANLFEVFAVISGIFRLSSDSFLRAAAQEFDALLAWILVLFVKT